MDSDEKLLIGSILSDDEAPVIRKNEKKKSKLSLNAQEFQPSFKYEGTSLQEMNELFSQDQISFPSMTTFTLIHDPRVQAKHFTYNFSNNMERVILKPHPFSPRKHSTMQPITMVPQVQQFKSHPLINQERKMSEQHLSDDEQFRYHLVCQSNPTFKEQICGNQKASRNLQKIFESGSYHQRYAIFEIIERKLLQTSKDLFGNYIVQKVFQHGEEQWKLRLFDQMKGYFGELAKNQYSSRVLHRVIEFIYNKEVQQTEFINEIRTSSRQLILDPHGCYVLLQCLDLLPGVDFLVGLVEDNLMQLSTHTYGCRIIQNLLQKRNNKAILSKIMENAESLCYCEFGNYIIQFMLRNSLRKEQQELCVLIKSHFEKLSYNKYGSNIVEVFLEVIGIEDIRFVTQKLLSCENGIPLFIQLVVHQYGNFVFKKYIQLDAQYTNQVIRILKEQPEYLGLISSTEYGLKVLPSIEKALVNK